MELLNVKIYNKNEDPTIVKGQLFTEAKSSLIVKQINDTEAKLFITDSDGYVVDVTENEIPLSKIVNLENILSSKADLSSLNNKIDDAPSDDKTYGRKNGVWEETKLPDFDFGEFTVTGTQKSSYQIASENGFSGSQTDWINILRNIGESNGSGLTTEQVQQIQNAIQKNPEASDKVLLANGKTISKTELQGADGKSAYQIAVENGFKGSETDFVSQNMLIYNTDFLI